MPPMKLLRRRTPRWYHALSANVRDTLVLLRQFRGLLILFSLTVIGGGGVYFMLARQNRETHPASPAEAIFLVLSMIFLQANADFPDVWYLQIFFFVMPALGLGILSQGAADFGVL